jgi:hypothetical protein
MMRVQLPRPPKRWPVLLLCLPAFVAIWGGWVGLGAMTGFGVINLLPGMVEDGGWATVNTAVTLPIGLETYAAYALHAALNTTRPGRLRTFSIISGVAALVLGGGGQLAYHVMESFGITTAPWPITATVATVPVAVLGAGAALAALMNREEHELEQLPAPALLEQPREIPAEELEQIVERWSKEQEQPQYVPSAEELELAEQMAALEQEQVEQRSARAPRAGKPEQEKAIAMMLAGQRQEAVDAGLMGNSTMRLYEKAARLLRNNPAEQIGPKLDGRSVRADLVEIIRAHMNLERAR